MGSYRRTRGPWEVATVEQYDFSAFVVNDVNREAFRLCQATAELRVMVPQPIVLVGAQGSGKSHLLHAIARRARQRFPDALCVGVSPHHFPDTVRALLDDAPRVREASGGILLVDHLERFDEGVDELGALVQLFLDHNRCVIIASCARPDELDNLTAGLRAILAGAQVVALRPANEARPVERGNEREGQPRETGMAEQIKGLENAMAQSEGQGEAVAGKAAGESVREAVRRETAQLCELLEAAQGDVIRAADEVFTLVRRTEELIDERDAAQEQCAQLRQTCEKLTGELEVLCEERKTAAAEVATAGALAQQLQTEWDEAVAERRDAESRLQGVAAQRDEVRGQLEQTSERLEALRQEHGALAEETEAAHGRIQQLEEELDALNAQRDDLQASVDDSTEECIRERGRADELEQRCQARTEELETLRKEHGALAEETEAAHGRIQQLEEELDALNAQRDDLQASVDDSTEECIRERGRADELEQRCQARTEELETLRKEHGALAEETEAAHGRIQQLEEELDALNAQRDDLQASVDDSTEECIRERGRADELEQRRQGQAKDLERLRQDHWALAQKTEAAHARVRELEDELGALSAQRDDLEARLDEALAGLSQDRERWARLEQEHQEQTEEFHALREAHVAVVIQAHALEMRLPDLENELKEARAVAGALQGRLDDALTERDRLAADMESVRENDQTAGDLRERLDVLIAENTSLTGEIAPLRRRLRVLANENVRARNTLDRLVPAVKKLMADMARERRQRAKLERGHKAQAAELQWVRQAREATLSEAQANTEIAAQLQTGLDTATVQRDRLQARLDGVLAERAELAETVAALRRTERALRDELDGTRANQASLAAAVEGLRAAAQREADQLRVQLETHLEISEIEERAAQAVRERDKARGEAETLRSELETSRQGLESAAVQLLPDAVATGDETAPEPTEILEGEPAAVFDWEAFVATCQNRRLGEILCANGNITQEQLDDALAAQAHAQDRKIGEILVGAGYTTEPDVVRGLAGQLGVPFVRLDDQAVRIDAIELLSGELAKRHCCMPLYASDEEVTLAMADPRDEVAIDDINRTTNLRVRVVATPTGDIEAALAEHYGV